VLGSKENIEKLKCIQHWWKKSDDWPIPWRLLAADIFSSVVKS